jgi:hypothetical protein
MTETTLRDREPSSAGAWLMRSLPSPSRGPGSPEAQPQDQPRDNAIRSVPDAPPSGRRDWSASLDLIHEATAAIRISEERASELEEELQRTVAQAQERAATLEAQIAVALNRAELAERRADDAEEWLARMHDAVVNGFSRREPQTTSAHPATSAA